MYKPEWSLASGVALGVPSLQARRERIPRLRFLPYLHISQSGVLPSHSPTAASESKGPTPSAITTSLVFDGMADAGSLELGTLPGKGKRSFDVYLVGPHAPQGPATVGVRRPCDNHKEPGVSRPPSRPRWPEICYTRHMFIK